MNLLKPALLGLLSIFIFENLSAQMFKDPTNWTLEAKKIRGNEYNIFFHISIDTPWHVYSLKPGGDGSLITPSFTFNNNKDIKLIGKIRQEGKIITQEDTVVGTYYYIESKATYIQKAIIYNDTKIKGTYSYQTCNRHSICLSPKEVPYSIEIKDVKGSTAIGIAGRADTSHEIAEAINTPDRSVKVNGVVTTNNKLDNGDEKTKGETKSLLWLFLAALGGGILAVLTPCVYSMIPITVSFFTKRSKTRAEGIKHAIQYSLSIIIVFTVFGVLISVFFGANALNTLSTNWIANLFFFAVFVIFGISFLGVFEISLPSSWTNKTDSKAGLSSFGGIFFMALTLVIVSFSCTGPIVGPLLVLAGKGGIVGPTLGMFGFSVGLALPFALFAIFPGMLNKMASSGGWLNQVKVVLGFVELMLALKFLSNADLAMGWRLLDREIFIAIWVVLALMLGFYLMGKFKLSHDDVSPKNLYGQEYVSIVKLFLSIVCFSFAVYLVPGMWGAPLNAVSAFVPPLGTQDFILNASKNETSPSENNINIPDKMSMIPLHYVNELKIYEPQVVKNLGLITYYDYNEALLASKKLKKPIMLDFTGINCVNCRKMESQVWSKPEVTKRLKENFIVASLYCDMNRIELPRGEQYFSKDLNSQVTTLGNKNADLQASKFESNSQPYYFYIDAEGNKLADKGYSYDPDVDKFVKHLDNVLATYQETHK